MLPVQVSSILIDENSALAPTPVSAPHSRCLLSGLRSGSGSGSEASPASPMFPSELFCSEAGNRGSGSRLSEDFSEQTEVERLPEEAP